jgi:hypothetical protein
MTSSTFWRRYFHYVRLAVLTDVVMKGYDFWDITPCSMLKVSRRFEGVRRLHLQDLRINSTIALLATCFQCWFLAWLNLRFWRWRRHVPKKCRLSSKRIARLYISDDGTLSLLLCLHALLSAIWTTCTIQDNQRLRSLFEILKNKKKLRERTTSTEWPPLVGEVSANFYYFFQVAPQLYSRGWVDPVLWNEKQHYYAKE